MAESTGTVLLSVSLSFYSGVLTSAYSLHFFIILLTSGHGNWKVINLSWVVSKLMSPLTGLASSAAECFFPFPPPWCLRAGFQSFCLNFPAPFRLLMFRHLSFFCLYFIHLYGFVGEEKILMVQSRIFASVYTSQALGIEINLVNYCHS